MKTRKIYNKKRENRLKKTRKQNNYKYIKGGVNQSNIDAVKNILNIIFKNALKQNGNSQFILKIINMIVNNNNNVIVNVVNNQNKGLSFLFSYIPGFTDNTNKTTINFDFNEKMYKEYDKNGVKKQIPRLESGNISVTHKNNPFKYLYKFDDIIKQITGKESKKEPKLKYEVVVDTKFTPNIKENIKENP